MAVSRSAHQQEEPARPEPQSGARAGVRAGRPRLLVFSRIFPNTVQPTFGVFVRERMFRVGQQLPVVVVSPVAWFPGEGLIRRFIRPDYRPPVPYHEVQEGVDVYHPKFLCIPGVMKWTDGLFLALSTLPLMRRLQREPGFDIIDTHFVYPDGVAVWLLSKWLRRPYTITLRGTIDRISRTRLSRWLSARAMRAARRVFSVSDSLRQVAIGMGQSPEHVRVIPNGINLDYFGPEDQAACRRQLGLPEGARVMITVGTLNERKGFHRVIEQLPALLEAFPDLHYLCVGGGSPDGNDLERLQQQAQSLGVAAHVHFTGAVPPERLRYYYSAADLFVLATRFEGWANVFLEAGACGLPTVTTRVGGNAEVVNSDAVGRVVAFGDGDALRRAIAEALTVSWDRQAILEHARAQSWEERIPILLDEFTAIHKAH
ncbi:glycosyltransferase [Aquisalimonas asiatica]|uniref:Glycosyltransferase involved in cell wall bisynthesis n=1 Tax=Aquisalimonas asiatica TaxID=406100 RepID=A0A1H8U3P8_9GAMM|nr:glycosyltransferase [Aquisalimonas asiatica]SEO97859.1 Glycosyltransferase involved in cell wall bisynthesis [Aquisalimonas asiatica]